MNKTILATGGTMLLICIVAVTFWVVRQNTNVANNDTQQAAATSTLQEQPASTSVVKPPEHEQALLGASTSTRDVGGYTVAFVRVYPQRDPTYDSYRVALLEEGREVFAVEGQDIFGLDAWFRPEIATSKQATTDVNGNGVPELFLQTWSGGAHCCTHGYIVELSHPIKVLFDRDVGGAPITLVDHTGDGAMEIETADETFAYWHASFANSPVPKVILSLQGGVYAVDPARMRKQVPSREEMGKRAAEVVAWDGGGSVVPWKYALDLMYSGNMASARTYIDLVWKDGGSEFSSKEDFWNQLMVQINKSPYYDSMNKAGYFTAMDTD